MSKAHKTNVEGHYIIFCPACGRGHILDQRWKFEGTLDNPTFSPSLLCNGHIKEAITYASGYVVHRCHSYIRDGKIEYLGDCTHDMKGQTVEIPDLDKPPY